MLPAGKLREPVEMIVCLQDTERKHVARSFAIAVQQVDRHRQPADAARVAHEPPRPGPNRRAFTEDLPELPVRTRRLEVVDARVVAVGIDRLERRRDALTGASRDRVGAIGGASFIIDSKAGPSPRKNASCSRIRCGSGEPGSS